MSDAGTLDDPSFKGQTPGGMSCPDFIRAVRKHAVFKERSRDNEYIADYAMSCFTDDALYWSESLPDEVQGDWSLLRRALLAEYGSSTRTPAPVVPSLLSAATLVPVADAAIIPTPAAAAPIPPVSAVTTSWSPAAVVTRPAPALQVQPTSIAFPVSFPPLNLRGRVKIISQGTTGYLSKHVDDGNEHFKWFCLAKDLSDACILSGAPGNGGIRFKFENLDPQFLHLGTHLGMIWGFKNRSYAALTPVRMQSSRAISKKSATSWTGPVTWVTWVMSSDNTLTPKLEGTADVGLTISASPVEGGRRLQVVYDVGSFQSVWGRLWPEARWVFEPI